MGSSEPIAEEIVYKALAPLGKQYVADLKEGLSMISKHNGEGQKLTLFERKAEFP